MAGPHVSVLNAENINCRRVSASFAGSRMQIHHDRQKLGRSGEVIKRDYSPAVQELRTSSRLPQVSAQCYGCQGLVINMLKYHDPSVAQRPFACYLPSTCSSRLSIDCFLLPVPAASTSELLIAGLDVADSSSASSRSNPYGSR